MASINHLEMCDQLKALPEIEIKKTCFGLFSNCPPTSTEYSFWLTLMTLCEGL